MEPPTIVLDRLTKRNLLEQTGLFKTLKKKEATMPYSVDDKCKKLAKCPEAAAIITEYSPGFTSDPQMKMVMGLTLRKLASFPQAKELADALDEIDARLKAIED